MFPGVTIACRARVSTGRFWPVQSRGVTNFAREAGLLPLRYRGVNESVETRRDIDDEGDSLRLFNDR